MFHQPNLRAYNGTNSLLGDLLDLTFAKYASFYNLPILSPTMDQMGDQVAGRMTYNNSGANGSYVPGVSVTIGVQNAATVPVTGLNTAGAEIYGGQPIAHLQLGAGQSQTFSLGGFADVPVPGKEWMAPWIQAFYEAGITTGCAASPLQFCPERPVTRAEMAVFLERAMNYPNLPYTPPNQDGTFADLPVPGKEWMEAWIEKFYDDGITTGCAVAPLRYCPERNVTRAEMAVFILRAVHGAGYTPPAPTGVFADVPVPGKEWMQAWIEAFYNQGITTGCAAGPLQYCPEREVTRAEMAVFVLRAFNGIPGPG
jgi:hypothetical protein